MFYAQPSHPHLQGWDATLEPGTVGHGSGRQVIPKSSGRSLGHTLLLLKSCSRVAQEFWRVLETPANLHFLQVHASLLLCGRKPSETVHTVFGEIGALPHNLCALANSWLLNNLSPF